jgi:hypothetical protein
MCGASSIMRNFLVEVFAVVKVNLLLFKGKIAGMRAVMRSGFVDFLVSIKSWKRDPLGCIGQLLRQHF